MLKPYYLLLIFSILLLCSSCDKKEDVSPSRADLLTADTWRGFAVYFNGEDITADLKQKQDFDIKKYTLKFEKKGTFIENYTENKYEGHWEFRNQEQEILYDKGTANESFSRITRLTEQELYLTDELIYEGKEAMFEFRYSR